MCVIYFWNAKLEVRLVEIGFLPRRMITLHVMANTTTKETVDLVIESNQKMK